MKIDYKIAIIGAGFAGIIAALELKKTGKNDFVIFERAKEVGGTWRDNVYPGCACDVPSPLYSIASEPNPNWSKLFSEQGEIFDYLKEIVKKRELNAHIQYETEIILFRFIESEGLWELTDRKGQKTYVQMLIMATGPLNRPNIPKLKGLDSFKGKQFHSAQWDKNYDLAGKKVAVIGTGASAIQFIPEIVNQVKQLTVFQRTAAWIGPRNGRDFDAKQKERMNRFPILLSITRNVIYWILEIRGRLFIGNKFIHRYIEKQCLAKLEKEVNDPIIRQKLTPNYTLGCKRALSSDNYLPVFNRENVELITEGIAEIQENAILDKAGKRHEIDLIIWGTGFDAAEVHSEHKVYGLNGRELFSEWLVQGMQAYKGTTVAGFPNLAFLLGPNTGLGHSSVVYMMESQMPYILQYIEALEKRCYLDVKEQVQKVYNDTLQNKFHGTVWESGCKSWYLDSKGKNTTLYPRLTLDFRRELKHFSVKDYDNFST